MQSGTSYFNSTLYRKTMLRFWPLWALYGLIWLFVLPLNMMTRYFGQLRWGGGVAEAQDQLLSLAYDIPGFLPMGVWLSMGFGVLAAMATFGYLYNNRSACMMHSLPMRREGLFTTQYLAGLSFLLLPQAAAGLLSALAVVALLPAGSWGMALSWLGIWLLGQCGIALFFYSFAVFCAMFTGHILALPAFYTILNFLVAVVSMLVSTLMSQFFYGFTLSSGFLFPGFTEACSPVIKLYEACSGGYLLTATEVDSRLLYALGTIAAYAAAGVVFAVLAMLVYRHRHVESAGDVVSIPLVRPVFLVGVTFCSGLCLGIFTAAFFGSADRALFLSLCVLFWSAVGYFAAQMLLRKTFQVLRFWKGCVLGVALMAVLCASLALDLFGVESRVPDPAQVASVDLTGQMGYPYDSGNNGLLGIDDPEAIGQIVALHQAILREKDRNTGYIQGDDYTSLNVTYTMKDGSQLSRRYYSVPLFRDEVELEGSVTWCAHRLFQNRALVAQAYDFDGFEEGRLVEAYLDYVGVRGGHGDEATTQATTLYLDGASPADLSDLWQAVRTDFDEGNIGVRYLFEGQERYDNTYITDLCFLYEFTREVSYNGMDSATYNNVMTITLTPNAEHTLAWLEKMEVLGEQYYLVPHGDAGGPQEAEPVQSVIY